MQNQLSRFVIFKLNLLIIDYREKHKEKIRKYGHQYYQENKEKKKEYYEKNKEKIREYHHQYYLKKKAGL